MKKNLLISSILFAGTLTTLSASLGSAPQIQEKKSQQVMYDGQSIVLGKYKNMQEADSALSGLLDFVDSNSKVVNLELAHGFDYAVKEKNGKFVVSIEPFTNEKILNDVLQVVKARYTGAHAEVCKACVTESAMNANAKYKASIEKEAIENAAAANNESEVVQVTVEEDAEPITQPAENVSTEGGLLPVDLPFDQKYLMYGGGGLALLILIFLIMRKPKKSSDKELRAMYAQAKALEKELEQEEGEGTLEIDETDLEPTPQAKPQPKPTPREKPAPQPKPVAQPQATPAPQVKPQAKPELQAQVKTEVHSKPTSAAPAQPSPVATPTATATSHKLREPNKALTSISKDNFKEFEGMRLLIAEDNLINQKVIVGLLKDSGINIKIANDGQECMDILAEDPNYPIILMDAHMPRIDGLEATRLIRKNPAYDHITVMALSGDTGADDVRKMREAGMEEQLEKPLKIAALYQALYCYFDPNAIGGADEALPEIKLDNSLGLEMLGGDVELYHEILREFEALYKDSDDKIEMWIKHGDLDKAKAILLDVKGIGESIGTAELTETAEEFREAIINGEIDKFDRLLKLYRSQLKSILADIAEV